MPRADHGHLGARYFCRTPRICGLSESASGRRVESVKKRREPIDDLIDALVWMRRPPASASSSRPKTPTPPLVCRPLAQPPLAGRNRGRFKQLVDCLCNYPQSYRAPAVQCRPTMSNVITNVRHRFRDSNHVIQLRGA